MIKREIDLNDSSKSLHRKSVKYERSLSINTLRKKINRSNKQIKIIVYLCTYFIIAEMLGIFLICVLFVSIQTTEISEAIQLNIAKFISILCLNMLQKVCYSS